jgi:hypothetical protein
VFGSVFSVSVRRNFIKFDYLNRLYLEVKMADLHPNLVLQRVSEQSIYMTPVLSSAFAVF